MALLAPISHGFLEDDGGAPGLYVTEAGVVVIRSVQGGPLVPVGGGGGGGGGTATIDLAQVVIGHADILTLPTTAVEIVPAPAPTEIILFLFGVVNKRNPGGFVPYTNVTEVIDGSAVGVFYPEGGGATLSAVMVDDDDFYYAYRHFWADNDATLELFPPNAFPDPLVAEGLDAINRSTLPGNEIYFGVQNPDGDFTGGDPANEIVVTMLYSIIDVG